MAEAAPRPRPEESGGLLVRGVKGFLEGEERLLEMGQSIVIGRSRHVDLSVRRSRRFQASPNRPQVIRSKRFLSVSRRHVRVHYLHPDFVEVEDLSQNGTYVDGRSVDRVALTDLRRRPHTLSLNDVEVIRIEWDGRQS